jgi:hypothetical protein
MRGRGRPGSGRWPPDPLALVQPDVAPYCHGLNCRLILFLLGNQDTGVGGAGPIGLKDILKRRLSVRSRQSRIGTKCLLQGIQRQLTGFRQRESHERRRISAWFWLDGRPHGQSRQFAPDIIHCQRIAG